MRKIIFTALISFFCLSTFAQKVVFFNSKKLPEEINSELDESIPILSTDGNTLYFVRSGLSGGKGLEDIWYSKKDEEGNWTRAKSDLKNLNNKEPNMIIGVSHENNKIYLRNAYDKVQKHTMSIAGSNFEKGTWQKPYNISALPDFGFKGKYYTLYISHNEKYLFVSMNMPGTSNGKEDLYLLIKDENNVWSEPFHLADNINSKGAEYSPFITEDGKYLFFSSDGHGGYGDMDIFVSERLDDTYKNWSNPRNLGKNINSEGFDAYFHVAYDNSAYYSSTRGGEQYEDIYVTKMHVFEKKKRQVIIHDLNNIEIITTDSENKTKKFKFVNIESMKDYLITHGKDTLITGDFAEFDYDIVFELDSNSTLKEKLMKLKNVKGYETLEDLFVGEKILSGENISMENLDMAMLSIENLENIATDNDSTVTEKQIQTILIRDLDNFEVTSQDKDEIKKFKFVNIASLKDYVVKHKDEAKLAGNLNDFLYDILFQLDENGELKKKLIKLKNVKGYETLEELYVAEKVINAEGKKINDVDMLIQFLTNLENILNSEDKQETQAQAQAKTESKPSPFKSGEIIQTISHDYDSDMHTKSTRNNLTNVMTALNNNAGLKIIIESHTDSKGSDAYNMELSKRRANNAKSYLVRNGVASSRIKVAYFGETKPIAENSSADGSDNPEGRAKNRRTEIKAQ